MTYTCGKGGGVCASVGLCGRYACMRREYFFLCFFSVFWFSLFSAVVWIYVMAFCVVLNVGKTKLLLFGRNDKS